METLSLEQFQCFNSSKSIARLIHLVEHNSSLMPHQVATATGCRVEEAMGLLLHLASISVVKAKLLVYHLRDFEDPPSPFASFDIEQGLPALPIICPHCDQVIETYDELDFDFIFIMQHPIRFVSSYV